MTVSKGVHAHGCKVCKTRYMDVCETPQINGLCTACHGGQPWRLLIQNREPKDCCRLTSRLATKPELLTYKLQGDAPWYICQVCARTQTYDMKGTQ